jgi:excisionase family DNA binding protein
MFPEVLTIEQLAQYLQLEAAFVLERVKKGEIPAAKIDGEWRVRREKIDQWSDELTDLSPV